MSEWILRVHVPGEPPRDVPIGDGLTLGRHPDSGCVIQDPRISANHARIESAGDGYTIEDLGSSNKTLIEGGAALGKGETTELRGGQVLILGETRVEVIAPDPVQATVVDVKKKPVESTVVVDGPADDVATVDATAPLPDIVDPEAETRPEEPEPKTEPEVRKPEPKPAADADEPEPPAPAEKEKVEQTMSKEDLPAEAAEPVPAAQPDESDADQSSYMGTVMGVESPMGELAKLESLKAARPRLVVVNEAFGGIYDIEKDKFTIGRRKKDDPDLLIDDRAVSGRHAEITYDGRRFFLKDLNSTNYTYIGDERLSADSPREIQSDMRVRFGSVETVFFTTQDAEGRPIPPERTQAALDYLVNNGRITAAQRANAQREAQKEDRSAGEILLKAGNVISAADWVEAVDRGRVIRTIQASAAGKSSNTQIVLWIVIALLLIVVAILAFQFFV